MFYGKLTRTTIPKILSVSPVTTKEHPYKVKKKNLQGSFFIIYEKLKNRECSLGILKAREKMKFSLFG